VERPKKNPKRKPKDVRVEKIEEEEPLSVFRMLAGWQEMMMQANEHICPVK